MGAAHNRRAGPRRTPAVAASPIGETPRPSGARKAACHGVAGGTRVAPCSQGQSPGLPVMQEAERSKTMSGTTEKVTGRVKEAAGALTDDNKLRREGKGDQLAGKAKDIADKAIDKVKDVAGK